MPAVASSADQLALQRPLMPIPSSLVASAIPITANRQVTPVIAAATATIPSCTKSPTAAIRRIVRRLRSHSVWVEPAPEPGLVKIANIQHLATPIHAQLAESRSAVELAGLLHPTPAVGGEPWERARALVGLEQLDRGWYAGPVGWMDSTEDGEFCVALRCALIEGRSAHCYAGGGVVADSDPESELAETEVKLQALLPALTGV